MSREDVRNLRPFLSILIIIGTLLSMVFLKMEVRRVGYSVLRLSRLEKKEADWQRMQRIQYARLIRPGRIEKLAQNRLSLGKAGRGQIIQIAGENVALRQ